MRTQDDVCRPTFPAQQSEPRTASGLHPGAGASDQGVGCRVKGVLKGRYMCAGSLKVPLRAEATAKQPYCATLRLSGTRRKATQ